MLGQKIDQTRIIRFYKRLTQKSKLKLPFSLEKFTLTNTPLGLGDTVVLTHLPRVANQAGKQVSIYAPSWCFDTLTQFNPYYRHRLMPFWAAADVLKHHFDLGNGHFIQRIQRAFGFTPELCPRGCIVVPGAKTEAGRVVFHFDAGLHSVWQRANVHPKARQIYPENMSIIQQFINEHQEMQFAEVGTKFSGLKEVEDWTNLPLVETIQRMSCCEYFMGIMSGPLHIAAALDLKIINIINFPDATSICLPTLKDTNLIESEWYYPQSVLLHQDAEGEFVLKFSLNNLERAINGELYPYWSHSYLDLIWESI